jgi:serine/threonine protein phosphatase PrpC
MTPFMAFPDYHQIPSIEVSTKSTFPKTLPENIHMPKLDLNYMDKDYIDKILPTDSTFCKEMASQGFQSDALMGAWSYSHYSTNYGLVDPNMDRGAVVLHPDGRMSACIADGVSGDGPLSTFVAQLSCQYIALELNKAPLHFTENLQANQQIVSTLLQQCAASIKNEFTLKRRWEDTRFKGSSTIAFATCSPVGNNLHKVHVGALGDSAVFHLSRTDKQITQLNQIHRDLLPGGRGWNLSDCGGCIMASGTLYKLPNLEVSSSLICEQDLLILVTDGLIDNLPEQQIPQAIRLIACHSFFDRSLDDLLKMKRSWCLGSIPSIPTVQELEGFIRDNDPSGLNDSAEITTELVTKRLSTYLEWLTQPVYCMIDRVAQGLQRGPVLHALGMPKLDDCMIITIKPYRG